MTKTSKITISVPMLLQTIEGATNAGFDINRLLKKCNIKPDVLEQSDARIPLEKFVLLSRYIGGVMDDELLGMLYEPVRLGFFHTLAINAVHATNTEQAFQRLITFNNLFENSLQLELKIMGTKTELIVTRNNSKPVLNTFGIEFLLATYHRFIGWLANQRIIINQVKLDYPEPLHNSEYPYIFYGAPVLFNQNCISINFDSHYLKRNVIKNEAEVESYVRRAPMDLYLPVHAGGKITAHIRERINDVLNQTEKVPDLETIAEELRLHPQTLRRQLKREGSSFHNITAQIRRDIAIQYLGGIKLSIEEIAGKTGYTETSAFIRAFKAWTGFTPLAFRKGIDSKI